MKLFFLSLITLMTVSSCVDIFDELVMHNDGTGTYKYTVNLSASKIKINSILALDSIDGRRVPSLGEIKDKIEIYKIKLEGKEGISNVKVDANYEDFVFKFSCDFQNVAVLQNGIREIVMEESKDKTHPLFSETWISWDGKQLARSVPNFQSPIHQLKVEDRESLRSGKYISVTRFDREIAKSDNTTAQISPSKTAVMVKASTYEVASNPSVLKNTILLGPLK